jgi:hypothetical protein
MTGMLFASWVSTFDFILYCSSGVGDRGKAGTQTFLKKHECVKCGHNLHLSHDRFAEDVRKESNEE